MVQVDLITGFLGSGKTTFIKKYAKYLIDQGLHIAILENDFGAINVDMMVLEEELGDREFDSCLQFFTNQVAQNVDYINAFEFFYCQIRENKCTNMG